MYITWLLERSYQRRVREDPNMATNNLAFSAPGKVLFTGGFLVLDRKHKGLVLGLDARIHVYIEDLQDLSTNGGLPQLLVRSPQFRNASWLYELDGGALNEAQFVRQVTE